MSDQIRIAIVNRGEAAVRLLQTTASTGPEVAFTTIALHTRPDRHSLFVRRADEALDLESIPATDPGAGTSPYLDIPRLMQALRQCRADMVWVGWGFVAEDAAFAAACEEAGVTFIGPSSASMALLSHKIRAKQLAESVGVPVTPWSGGPVETLEDLHRHAETIGYPVFIKSAAGGGGLGIREVLRSEELDEAFASARREALRAFGDATVFLEKRVDSGRHVEVQVLADRHGTTWPVGVRECSIQRRRQKVLEESGFSVPDLELESVVRDHATQIIAAANYVNAGTVEFMIDSETGVPYFMEVNTRLQVEHTVTEESTGLDLVAHQIHIARGGRLEGPAPAPSGHAIEVRLNAEDPENEFAPSPGRVVLFRPPQGPGIRTDAGIEQGDDISADFDSMTAKIIAWGPDRQTALRRLRKALDQTEVVVAGGATNKSFLQAVLRHPDVERGNIHTRWLDELVAAGSLQPPTRGDVAMVQAAIEAYSTAHARDCEAFISSIPRGRPLDFDGEALRFELGFRGATHTIEVNQPRPQEYHLVIDDTFHLTAHVDSVDGNARIMRLDTESFRTYVLSEDGSMTIDVDGLPHKIIADGGGTVRAGFPGMIVSVQSAVGDVVRAGDTLLTIEAMKMESRVLAPSDGVVREVHVTVNSQVGSGQSLVRLDLSDAAVGEVNATGIDFSAIGSATPDARAPLDVLDTLLRGLDLTTGEESGLTERLQHSQTDATAQVAREREAITVFCDIQAIRLQRIAYAGNADSSSREHLIGWLRERTREDRAFSPEFLDRLSAAHVHVAAAAAEEDSDLGYFRLHRSLRRSELLSRAVSSVLRRWLSDADTLPVTPDLNALLDRLINVAESWSPQLSGLARSVQFRLFTQPVIDQRQRAAVTELLERIHEVGQEDAGTRVEGLRFLAGSSTPWEAWLPESVRAGDLDSWIDALIVIMASNYRHRPLRRVPLTVDAVPVVLAEHRQGDATETVIAAAQVESDAGAAADVLRRLVAERAALGPVKVELLVSSVAGGLAGEIAEACAEASELNLLTLPESPGQWVRSQTYRPRSVGLSEQALHRDLHPTVTTRLELWRLERFDLQRQPAPVGTYLFAGTAHEDVRDKRLFALAEVRFLTPILDEDGGVTSVPELELALTRCLDAFRAHDSSTSTRSPYGWNRAILYVEPVWDLPMEALRTVAERVSHAASGLSVEQAVLRLRRSPDPSDDLVVHMTLPEGRGVQIGFKDPSDEPVSTLRSHRRVAAQLRRRGLHHPHDIVMLLTSPGAAHSDLPVGTFQEMELEGGRLVPIDREPGANEHGVVVGLIRNATAKHPEGMERVIILNDASKGMASLGEGECARIVAALQLARERGLPTEWFAVSSGARVSMDSGTENLDWTARVLRAIIEMTQDGHEINVVVAGVNVGAQSYWDAEATMLMHTRGILVSVADNAMVLTGKEALDYSGAVSAEDNAGVGGYERIMGPNGESQYWAATLAEACHLLFRHYEVAYVAPGESAPRRRPAGDPAGRSVAAAAHTMPGDTAFATVGDIFSDALNPERKMPFDIRSVMGAIADRDAEPLERWPHMRDAENAVVWDTHVAGFPVSMIGIESHDLVRHGLTPNDGPRRWSAGTLFPKSSKKVARALNAASGIRPTVILANLSGFDGSPESMRELQLEYGAEIGRAVVNYQSPLVFCVLSRYHGGAFVVFSKALNERLESIALTGARASVLGGAPAAAVVFARDVAHRAASDPRVKQVRQDLDSATPQDQELAKQRLSAVEAEVVGEMRGQVGREFDSIHTIERAMEVGSIDRIVDVDGLRDAIIEALARPAGLTLVGGPDEGRQDS